MSASARSKGGRSFRGSHNPMTSEGISLEEMADLMYDALNWVSHAKASNEVALTKLHEIISKAHLIKKHD